MMQTPNEMRQLLDKYAGNIILQLANEKSLYMRTDTRWAFAAITELKNKLYIRKLVFWLGCRGYICEAWFGTINGQPFLLESNDYNIKKHIHDKAACLLVKDISELALSQCMKILNYLERNAGWEETFFVKASGDNTLSPVFLVIGPKQWFAAPVYISMWLFLIRTANKVIPEVNDTVESWLTRAKVSNRITDTSTICNLFKCHTNVIQVLMENQEFILEKDDFHHYRRGRKQGSAHDAGISMFVFEMYRHREERLDCPLVYNERVRSNEISRSGVCHLHPHAIVRASIAIQEYGKNI